MTSEQLSHARCVNSQAADVVIDYMTRRQHESVDAALEATADYWGLDVQALAVYLRSRVDADSEALKAWAPFSIMLVETA